ncbi:hypothetical protein ROZALSC1DRAFT_24526 [Rozella allomycis CSF55]|uniref:E3 ubiquitin-protein ligase listerin n=1 Tax=Rozella allomycis (strain CSF55) TaxID=988480 RepID=A0A4P9YFN9_ROZAC|nr:hypothetical protein ROZALSC1DRAFT_24526 [Rozella allomycis CSF55]
MPMGSCKIGKTSASVQTDLYRFRTKFCSLQHRSDQLRGVFNPFRPTATELDPELVVLLKKLSKKDIITRQKSLEQISAMIETVDNVGEFAGVFVKPYVKLCVDGAKSVREGVNRVVGEILKRDKKALAPVLREYSGAWFCSWFDPAVSVQGVSKSNFERGDLKDSCADYEDVEFKFARIVGSGLMMVGYLVENGYVEDVNEGMMDVEIWNNILNKENNVFLRQSGFKLIKIMLSKGMKLNMEIQKNILMNAFEEEESLLVESLWECILLMSERNIEIWEKNVPKKPLLNRFYGYLENGCKRQGNLVYPFILPLLNLIGEKINVKLFVNAIWKGIRSEYLEFSLIFLVVKTFVENLNYLIKNSIREKDWLEKEAILIPFEDWLFSNDSLIGNDQKMLKRLLMLKKILKK